VERYGGSFSGMWLYNAGAYTYVKDYQKKISGSPHQKVDMKAIIIRKNKLRPFIPELILHTQLNKGFETVPKY
jgi:hypothetical protein